MNSQNYNREYYAKNKHRWPERNRIRRGWKPGEHAKAVAALAARPACEACGRKELLKGDHDHATGLFRGILCHWCNIVLGFHEKRGFELNPQLSVYMALRRR